MSFSQQVILKGFGLPLAEAIACGCIVVGYDGLGSRDFCYPALHSVPFGDILSFVNTLELGSSQLRKISQDHSSLVAKVC